MADFWDEISGGKAGLPQGNDPGAIAAYFQQKAGRAPTDDELAAYTNGTPNWQQQIDANVAAPNGYSNLSQFGNVNGDPASGNAFGAIPAAYVPPANGSQNANYVGPQFTEAAPTFTAPTDVTMENDPGYLFRINQVRQQGERMAAAKGSVLNAGTVSAINDRVGDQASAEFGNVFGRAATTFDKALATYGAKYNVFEGNAGRGFQANQANNAATAANNATAQTNYGINYGVTKTAQDDYWSRLMDQARLGASSAAA